MILNQNVCDTVYHLLVKKYVFEHKKFDELTSLNNLNDEYLLTINNKYKFNFLLFLTTINNKKYSIFILNNNGRLYFYSVKLRFHISMYNGTLFIGELVKNVKDCWIYYMSDIVYYKDKYVHRYKMSQKLKLMSEILKNEYVFDDFLNPCHIQLKSYFLFNHLKYIKKNCKVHFIPNNYNENKYYLDINVKEIEEDDPLIIKENDMRNFYIKRTDVADVYELYNIDDNRMNSIACISKLNTSIFVKELFTKYKQEKIEIIAKYSSQFNGWIPVQKS
jgi:hypothetical protein